MLSPRLTLVCLSLLCCSSFTQATLDKRDFNYTPLQSQDSPKIEEIHHKKWDSHWLMAPVGALAHTQKDKLKSVFKSKGEGEKGETQSADFTLYDSQGHEQTLTINQSEILGDADWTKADDGVWWSPGIETAGLKMKGYLGLDEEKTSRGDPVKAFKMLTNERATLEAVRDKDRFTEILHRAQDIPVIMGTSSGGDDQLSLRSHTWHTILSYTERDDDEINGEVVKDAVIYWNFDKNKKDGI
ncbi:hypothetical protein I302_107684 [Kwoniella bestiolae CBS 10118]|uniref:Uncharacterized protein n=1 Tax=Kwoniella bestiolae CBS 10118 TaxID=1296100 RepID=A0A1B9FXU9_9TREE|nr:hypothetical protein I302_06577 [Kwoniella bestiolae CBS 10118]OCF23594.1 hypothetical protein I302_06577 [Kwoniella bestiolae CBS 10118]